MNVLAAGATPFACETLPNKLWRGLAEVSPLAAGENNPCEALFMGGRLPLATVLKLSVAGDTLTGEVGNSVPRRWD